MRCAELLMLWCLRKADAYPSVCGAFSRVARAQELGADRRRELLILGVSAFSRCGVAESGLTGSSQNHGDPRLKCLIELPGNVKRHCFADLWLPAGAVRCSARGLRLTSICFCGWQPRSAIRAHGRDSYSGERRPHEWIDGRLTWSMGSTNSPRSWAPTA